MNDSKMLKIENLENYLKIKGFGDEKTLFLFYIFLNFYLNSNKKKNINIIEFGVYYGRASKLIFDQVSASCNFKLDLIDIAERDVMSNIFNDVKNVEFFKMKSEQYVQKKNKKTYDICHLDSNHHYDTILSELDFIRQHSNENTLIVVDDFNQTCPQVMKACFDFCSKTKKKFNFFKTFEEFEICLAGFNKAYIVNKKKFSIYEDFILNELQNIYSNNKIKTRLGRSELKETRCFNLIETNLQTHRYAENSHLKDFYKPT